MNGSRTRLFRWLLALFVVMGLFATTGVTAAQDGEDCIPADAASFLDPDGDLFISVQELESFVELLRTIDPAEYEGDLEGDIAAIEDYIDLMYSNDITGYEYVLCQVPPEVTPEPTIPPQVTPEPTTPPNVEPEPTVAPPVEEETWVEPDVSEPGAPVEGVDEPVVAQVAPAVVTLPNTGAGPAAHDDSTLTYASIAAGGAMLLLAALLYTRRARG